MTRAVAEAREQLRALRQELQGGTRRKAVVTLPEPTRDQAKLRPAPRRAAKRVELTAVAVADALGRLDLPVFNLDSPHVTLSPRQLWVENRGYVNLSRGWFVYGEEDRAEWVDYLDVDGDGGFLEIWLNGLAAGTKYLADITLQGSAKQGAQNPRWHVGSSAGFYADFPVAGGFPTQHLYCVLEPNDPMALVELEPHGITYYAFSSATVSAM